MLVFRGMPRRVASKLRARKLEVVSYVVWEERSPALEVRIAGIIHSCTGRQRLLEYDMFGAHVVRRNSATVLSISNILKWVRHVCRPPRYSGLFCHTLAYELGCTVMRMFRQCSVDEDLLANCKLSTRAF